jgi:hypothetical protein
MARRGTGDPHRRLVRYAGAPSRPGTTRRARGADKGRILPLLRREVAAHCVPETPPSAAQDAREAEGHGRQSPGPLLSGQSPPASTSPRRSSRGADLGSVWIRGNGATATLAVAGEGAASGLGQQYIVGGHHDEPAVDERAADLAPDRPAHGIPIRHLELLEGCPIGGSEPLDGCINSTVRVATSDRPAFVLGSAGLS